jgi:hypothetical protein
MKSENFFDGEVVLIYLVNPPEAFVGGIPIVNPVIEEKEGMKFIVGRMPSDPSDWASDMPVGVALKQVAHYLVFSSLDEFYQKYEFLTFGEHSVQ